MLGDERFRVKGRSSERWQVSAVHHIPESDADISQKSPTVDPFDRRVAEQSAALSIVECQVVTQWHLRRWSGREGRFARDRGEAVPRARIKKTIAAIHPISH